MNARVSKHDVRDDGDEGEDDGENGERDGDDDDEQRGDGGRSSDPELLGGVKKGIFIYLSVYSTAQRRRSSSWATATARNEKNVINVGALYFPV